ncbi:MAG TPA: glycosyltransferase family 4 protein [Candidatus Paceibacterota bacterium]
MEKSMKILIATGIYPPDIGGPAEYAFNLEREFRALGYEVNVLSYRLEKKLPIGIRHLYYFFRTVFSLPGTTFILALDTWSVGLPALLAAKLFGKKVIMRIGGDFLWESYVERSKHMIPLSRFYGDKSVRLNVKEKIIKMLMGIALRNTNALAFTTEWQKNIMSTPYAISPTRTQIIPNYVGMKLGGEAPSKKNFIFSTRSIVIKNEITLREAFAEAKKIRPEIELDTEKLPHEKFMEKIKSSYAIILPSLSEVCPNLILEAIQRGKPFILTKDTGLYETVKNLGIFVDPLDKEAITKAILRLVDDAEYREYVKNIETFAYRHSWGDMAEEYINLSKKI